jgi:hypothetical protein
MSTKKGFGVEEWSRSELLKKVDQMLPESFLEGIGEQKIDAGARLKDIK